MFLPVGVWVLIAFVVGAGIAASGGNLQSVQPLFVIGDVILVVILAIIAINRTLVSAYRRSDGAEVADVVYRHRQRQRALLVRLVVESPFAQESRFRRCCEGDLIRFRFQQVLLSQAVSGLAQSRIWHR